MENERNDNWKFNPKFPYKCKIIDGGKEFVPTMINYDAQQVWRQVGQTSEKGEWISFDDVVFRRNKAFNGINPV